MKRKEKLIIISHAKIRDGAIEIVKKYYKDNGWKYKVVGKPYDLRVFKGNYVRYVEVKGTMNKGGVFRALLSKNEKEFMEGCAKKGMPYYLHVVRGIGRHKGKPDHKIFTKSLISKPIPVDDYYIRVNMNEGKS